VRLVGFIKKKFVTMHGHVNVKFTFYIFRVLINVLKELGACPSPDPN